MDVTLTQEQIKQLETAILEIPTKYGIPLIQLISGFIQQNSKPPKPSDVLDAEEV